MSCDVGEATESLENELGEWVVTQVKRRKAWRLSCDVGEALRRFTYGTAHYPSLPSLYLRHNSFSNPSVASPTSQLILQPFRCLTYVTSHSTSLPSLYLRHSSFSNPSVASPTSEFIHQHFFRFSYVTGSSLTSPGESPMLQMLQNIGLNRVLRHTRNLTQTVSSNSSWHMSPEINIYHCANFDWCVLGTGGQAEHCLVMADKDATLVIIPPPHSVILPREFGLHPRNFLPQHSKSDSQVPKMFSWFTYQSPIPCELTPLHTTHPYVETSLLPHTKTFPLRINIILLTK